ncbi:MAG: Clp1/GlmU family protein [Candidatus Acetothermia bacterium]
MTNIPEFPFDFQDLLKKIGDSDLILVLGGVDTGKTTLIKGLQNQLGGEVIDSDVGQSSIGPPALVSRGTFRDGLINANFVGDLTPRGNLIQVMTGIAKMAYKSTSPCVVDTDGWIEGEGAQLYKCELIDLLEPDILILLEREDELEGFRTNLSASHLIRLPAQNRGTKSAGERATNRTRSFKYYFYRAKNRFRKWDQIVVTDPSLGLKSKEELNRANEKHRLVGCYRKFQFLGLGTISALGEKGIEIFTPSENFNRVKLGKIKVKPSGHQIA